MLERLILGGNYHIVKYYQRPVLGTVLSLSTNVCFTPKKVVSWIISKVRFAPTVRIRPVVRDVRFYFTIYG